MLELADRLSNILGRMVVDQTGLTGTYDLKLEWQPDESQVTMFQAMRVPEGYGARACALLHIVRHQSVNGDRGQQQQEIGVRMALGAESSDVRNMVVWQGMRLALVGVRIGTAAAFVLRRVMEHLVWGIETADRMVFFAVPVILSSVALLAVWIPALRASRTDPVEALRQE